MEMDLVKDWVKELTDFHTHLDTMVHELLDDLDDGKDLDKYDLTITVNGKSITLPMGADLYSRLEQLIVAEVEDITGEDFKRVASVVEEECPYCHRFKSACKCP